MTFETTGAHGAYQSSLRLSSHDGSERLFTIGDLARDFGTTLRALRFYEDKGLLNPQRDGTRRLYSAVDRNRLALILKGKKLGFTLTELRSLVGAAGGNADGLSLTRDRCVSQLAQLERQRTEIDEAIGELRGMVQELSAA